MHRQHRVLVIAEAAKTRAERAREGEVEARARAEDQLYLSNVSLAHREWMANNAARAWLKAGVWSSTRSAA